MGRSGRKLGMPVIAKAKVLCPFCNRCNPAFRKKTHVFRGQLAETLRLAAAETDRRASRRNSRETQKESLFTGNNAIQRDLSTEITGLDFAA